MSQCSMYTLSMLRILSYRSVNSCFALVNSFTPSFPSYQNPPSTQSL